MSNLSLDLELFGDSPDAVPSPIQNPGEIQAFSDVAHTEQPRSPQHLGWLSPSDAYFDEGVHRDVGYKVSSFRHHVEDHPAEPSREDLVAELERLNAMMVAINDRVGQIETAPTPKTPPKATIQPVRPQTTPRKRTASRVVGIAASPSKRPRSAAPGPVSMPQGTIEAMWSPGVTPEQRRAIIDSSMQPIISTTGAMSAPFTPNQKTSSPAATLNPSPTPTCKPVTKRARAAAPKKPRAPRKSAKAQPQHQRTQSTPALPTFTGGVNVESLKFLTPQAPRPSDRTISELYKENFMSLGLDEKARILLPLLQGNDPETGMRWAEPGSLGRELMATPQTTTSDDFSPDPCTPYTNLPTNPAASSDAAGFGSFMPTPSAEASSEPAALPSYSFDSWAETPVPVTQTSTGRASSDRESDGFLSTPPATIQVPSEQASDLSQADINSLLSYIRDDAIEVPDEQDSAPDALNFDAPSPAFSTQSVSASATPSETASSLLQDFNAQITATDPFATESTEAAADDFSEFVNDADVSTSDPFAFNSSEDFSQFVNDDIDPSDPFAMTSNSSAVDFSKFVNDDAIISDPFALNSDFSAAGVSDLVSDSKTTAFDPFACTDMSSDFFPFDHSDNAFADMSSSFTSSNMSTGLTNTSTDMPFTGPSSSISTFTMDNFLNSPIDVSYMVAQATAQIQAPDGGAKRQREACMEHDRRVAEGRRR